MELSFYSVAACLAICQYKCSNFVLALRNLTVSHATTPLIATDERG